MALGDLAFCETDHSITPGWCVCCLHRKSADSTGLDPILSRQEYILGKPLAGRNTFWANLAGVLFGVFMYFPTLVEVPVAQTFLSLGMHRGPLLAYLLADPELSLQSILITNKVIGKKKTALYVLLVSVFSTLSGLIFGWFIQ